ncbi:glycosyltransferase [Chryseobacterium wangxinyae]|uniref:glycosyltransferase n=1 Tax=Chryseobacterium sp. CY350 TaxID=2997336 RepID=UPI00226FB0EC|nr:glycosyltransferase [Chryseobacterium sp. CY350]MCY0979375.1 glycosyltransferase [Chryseobacterium sp. CY350]WBZ97129.1 glycosyltransferase [Chryseobacterium sp. CY350]
MEFDKIIITNLPAFYKVNLFNEISKTQKVFVIFTGNTAELRNEDFFKKELIKFKFVDLKNKSSVQQFAFLLKLIVFSKYKELILGGWDEPLLWFASLLSAKRKNSIIVESSIYESKTEGFKAFIKKLVLNRVNRAYASGEAQMKLLKALNFNHEIKKTKGVGLFNIKCQPYFQERTIVKNFLYVGRLSPEKNLLNLIQVFNSFPNLNLHIIGFGPQEKDLKNIALENVKFHGAISNVDLYKFYQNYDVFILPSLIEPWGLVVEEALNNGMPVIVSEKVGCSDEIVVNDFNGLIFNLENQNSLLISIKKMTDKDYYNNLRKNVSEMDFYNIAEEQVKVYLA